MRSKKIVFTGIVAVGAVVLSLILISAFVSAASVKAPPHSKLALPVRQVRQATTALSVTFPMGDWPWYAQEEITLRPEPPLPHRPVEICAEVINEDPSHVHTATLEFRVANFGIGVAFDPIGQTDIEVPPIGTESGCVVWVPPKPGHWCIEVLLHQPGAPTPMRSQRNIDIWEPLAPDTQHTLTFTVGPLAEANRITFTHHNLLPNWDVAITPQEVSLAANEEKTVSLTTYVPRDVILGTLEPIVDIEGYVNGELIGGFRKMDTPPVVLHHPKEPFFAESEINIWPYPPRVGEPTQICVEVYNLSNQDQKVELQFHWANFGIGLPWTPINGPLIVEVPAYSHETACITWVPPFGGHFCVQVDMHILGDVPYHAQSSQRNLDVAEVLVPGQPHTMTFKVGNFPQFTNPDPVETDIWLETDIHLDDWRIVLEPQVLQAVAPETSRWVTMTVTPPDELPEDGTPVVDVRAMMDGAQGPFVFGGFRKVFRPPVPLHRFPDPPYAEREISVHPYPPMKGEPAEVCVELYNPTPVTQTVTVHFSWAHFGIGIPFTPVNGPRNVTIPPNSVVKECIHWIPPVGGHVCLQVILEMAHYPPQRSQRNIDVDEPLVAGVAHTLPFTVENPFDHPVDIELGLIPHVPNWEIYLDPGFLADVGGHEQRVVSLTVQPPVGAALPSDGEPIVDVEAYAPNEQGDIVLIGGFRKIHRPPVPLHPFPDPPYAEREISVHPYPPLAGEPTEICVELRNPTPRDQDVHIQFSWAKFGIGIPWTPINGLRSVHLPAYSTVKECIHWVPPVDGHVCLQVELLMDTYPPQRSQRNIDIDEPLEPGTPHTRPFLVGNPTDKPMTITLGLIPHRDGWGFELSEDVLPNMLSHTHQVISLTVVPPPDRPLPGDNEVIVDVEAYGDDGALIGGFRKIHRPPVPLHPFPDPPYAEREIKVHPYPPLAGEPTEICVELRNPTPRDQDVDVQFAWANFGVGLPWTHINGLRPVHLPAYSIVHECIHWIPPTSGHMCLQVELFIPGYQPQRSQRNIDVDEPLVAGHEDTLPFTVGNPFPHPVTLTLGLVPHLPDWHIELSADVLKNLPKGATRTISLTVIPPPDQIIPEDDTPIVDIEVFADGELIGGFRKIHRPPVPLHPFPDPPYAEREISVEPYPPRAGEPTEICVELRNPTPWPQNVEVQFSWANFGIGLPWTPINGRIPVHLPPFSIVKECIHWVPPHEGHVCLQVELLIDGHRPQRSQRNIDVDEPLRPNTPHERWFPVGNFSDRAMTITLGLIPHVPDWEFKLSTDMLPNMKPGDIHEVSLTVIPPDELPDDGHPIVDVEAYDDHGELIGGFRKIFRPPVPIHRPKDPRYAESEIFIHPYPPREREPTEVGVEIRNPTEEPQMVTVTFSAADFGIGLPFASIHEPVVVELPPGGMARPHIMWVPPRGGLWCIEVAIELPGHRERFISRRNIDVGEPLEPETPHARPFPVRNPFNRPVTITLGLVPHFPDWELELSRDVLRNMQPEEVREVVLTVTPPKDLPADGDPIVDVEAFVEGELLGGFRKIFRPPVPVHRPKDPIYAESEIGADPYPVIPGQPVKLSVEVFNPTDKDRIVTATFRIAPFGIGLPFSITHIAPNPIAIFVPANGAARGHVMWEPPEWLGKFCVEVTLEMPNHDKIWSRRNIDVGEPLHPGEPHTLRFPVGAWPHTEPVTINLGLIQHRDGWDISLSHKELRNVVPGEDPTWVSLTVTPTANEDIPLGTGEPIVDVEAFVEGELLGGFRKLDIPPIPIHKPHEKRYAETELNIDPDPPKLGQPAKISAVIQNNGPTTNTVLLEFGWSKFGMGILFTQTGIVDPVQPITLGAAMTATAWVTWTPQSAGHHCVQVRLMDPGEVYTDMVSQRNVDVVERPPCDVTRVYSFTVYNHSSFSSTVDLGLITFNVPESWQVSTEPTGMLELGPFSEGVVKVIIYIPCPTMMLHSTADRIARLQADAGSVPTVDVEGYIDGELVGGIELQFTDEMAAAGVDFAPDLNQDAQPGDTLRYTHTLTNTGAGVDAIALQAVPPAGWAASLQAYRDDQSVTIPVQLESFMTTTVVLSLTVPMDAISDTYTTVITATSTTGSTPFAYDAVVDTTVVTEGWQYIYLPLVLKEK